VEVRIWCYLFQVGIVGWELCLGLRSCGDVGFKGYGLRVKSV